MLALLSLAFAFDPAVAEAWDRINAVTDEVGPDGSVSLRMDSAGSYARIERTWRVPVGDEVGLRVTLRTEDSQGPRSTVILRVYGDDGELARHAVKGPRGPGERQTVTATVAMPEGARSLRAMVVTTGKGVVWVDEAELLADGAPLELPRPPAGTLSGVDLRELTPRQIDDLVVLAKVWGLLRWHHPDVARGAVDGDLALLEVLPEVLAATDEAARNAILTAWVGGLGSAAASPAEPPKDLQLSPELGWLRDEALLGAELSAALLRIHESRPIAYERRIGRPNATGGADFADEHPWEGPTDAGLRILGVFRLWTAVAWMSPYRDLIDRDWDEVLAEVLPEAVAATEPIAWARAAQLAVAVGDSHTAARGIPDPARACRLPERLGFVEDQLVVREVRPGSPLQVGDVIAAVDGVPVAERSAALEPLIQGSNPPTVLRNLARALSQGPCDTSAEVSVDGGATVTIPRVAPTADDPIANHRAGPALQELAPGVVYLKIEGAEDAEVPSYVDAMKDARAIVIDARGYPTAFMVFSLGTHFVAEKTPFARFTRLDEWNPGGWSMEAPTSLSPVRPHLGAPIAVLVDEGSQSSAEYHAMAFSARPDVVVVGSTTAAADGNVTGMTLPGGLSVYLTGIGVFWPDGTPTQRVGIPADIPSTPTVAGIRAGRDEVLEAALAHLLPDLDPETRVEMARWPEIPGDSP